MDELTTAIRLSILGGLVAGGLFYVYTWWRKSRAPSGRGAVLLGLIAFVAILVVLGLSDGLIRVEEGAVAVVIQSWEAQTVLGPGQHFKLPFIQDVAVYHVQEIVYETRPGELVSRREDGIYVDKPVDTITSDAQPITVFFTIRFRIDESRVVDIFENLGDEGAVVDKLIKANARVRVRNILKGFSAADLQGEGLVEVEQALEEQLQRDCESEGVRLISFELHDIEFKQD